MLFLFLAIPCSDSQCCDSDLINSDCVLPNTFSFSSVAWLFPHRRDCCCVSPHSLHSRTSRGQPTALQGDWVCFQFIPLPCPAKQLFKNWTNPPPKNWPQFSSKHSHTFMSTRCFRHLQWRWVAAKTWASHSWRQTKLTICRQQQHIVKSLMNRTNKSTVWV